MKKQVPIQRTEPREGWRQLFEPSLHCVSAGGPKKVGECRQPDPCASPLFAGQAAGDTPHKCLWLISLIQKCVFIMRGSFAPRSFPHQLWIGLRDFKWGILRSSLNPPRLWIVLRIFYLGDPSRLAKTHPSSGLELLSQCLNGIHHSINIGQRIIDVG